MSRAAGGGGVPPDLRQFFGLLQLFGVAAEALGAAAGAGGGAVGAGGGEAGPAPRGLLGAEPAGAAAPSRGIDLLLRPLVLKMLARSTEALKEAEHEARAPVRPGGEAAHAARVAAHLAVASTTTSVLTALTEEILTPAAAEKVRGKLAPLIAKGTALARALAADTRAG